MPNILFRYRGVQLWETVRRLMAMDIRHSQTLDSIFLDWAVSSGQQAVGIVLLR